MEYIVTPFLASFVAAVAFAILYRVPRAHLISAGIIGATGFITFFLCERIFHSVIAVFFGASLVSLLSELWARRAKQPVTLFLIPGIIPLVPGAQAYVTMLSFLRQDFSHGMELFITMLFFAGAIAGGIVSISSFFRFRHQRRRQIG